MKKSIKIILILAVIGIVGVLLLSGFSKSSGYLMTVNEVIKDPEALQGKFIRLEGKIDLSSAQWDSEKILLTFDVIQGKDRLTIIYNGLKPDNFERAETAIVEGKLNSKGQFVAEKLMIKCPSKYEEKDRKEEK